MKGAFCPITPCAQAPGWRLIQKTTRQPLLERDGKRHLSDWSGSPDKASGRRAGVSRPGDAQPRRSPQPCCPAFLCNPGPHQGSSGRERTWCAQRFLREETKFLVRWGQPEGSYSYTSISSYSSTDSFHHQVFTLNDLCTKVQRHRCENSLLLLSLLLPNSSPSTSETQECFRHTLSLTRCSLHTSVRRYFTEEITV